LFQSEPHIQQGGVSMSRYHVWFGQWRETDETGKRVMRTVRLGDYELPTKEAAQRALKRIFEKQPGAHRPQVPPGRLSRKSLGRIISQAARRAGLGDVHPHQLRHSFATHLINHSADILYVCHLLGHANVSVTARYIHIAVEDLIQTHHKFHPRGK
jgi:site-specific recombinase XerD